MRLIDADTLPYHTLTPLCGQQVSYVCLSDILRASTIDPIRAVGGCRCGECKHLVDGAKCYTPFGARLPSQECIIVDSDDFCSYGKPREVQDDG